MVDTSTTYLGLTLKNPIVAGASKLTANMEKIKELEAAGVAAIVCSTLFEEQVELERYKLEQETNVGEDITAEMIDLFPHVEHGGPAEHIKWVKKTKEEVNIPVIASINATKIENWVHYAKELEATGIDALELNFYFTPQKMTTSVNDIEAGQLAVLRAVKQAVNIPVGVKLSFFYSNPLNFIHQLQEEGAAGVIVFNRLFQPDIDIHAQVHIANFHLSHPGTNRLAIRYAGLLHGQTNMSVIANTGIHNADDLIKVLLAGADAAQMVSTFYLNGASYAQEIIAQLTEWMDHHNYSSIEDFKGKLSAKNVSDPFIYKRAQYVGLLMNSDELLKDIERE